jgi:hypothetical protein
MQLGGVGRSVHRQAPLVNDAPTRGRYEDGAVGGGRARIAEHGSAETERGRGTNATSAAAPHVISRQSLPTAPAAPGGATLRRPSRCSWRSTCSPLSDPPSAWLRTCSTANQAVAAHRPAGAYAAPRLRQRRHLPHKAVREGSRTGLTSPSSVPRQRRRCRAGGVA